jgi:hypothetical protein
MLISDTKDVDRIKRMIAEASAAVGHLDKLDDDDATDVEGRKAWRKVFRHSFFDEPVAKSTNALAGLEKKSAFPSPALSLATLVGLTEEAKADRLKSAVDTRLDHGGGNKPWTGKE